MLTTAGFGPVLNKEPGIPFRSLTWVAGNQVLLLQEHTISESWTGSGGRTWFQRCGYTKLGVLKLATPPRPSHTFAFNTSFNLTWLSRFKLRITQFCFWTSFFFYLLCWTEVGYLNLFVTEVGIWIQYLLSLDNVNLSNVLDFEYCQNVLTVWILRLMILSYIDAKYYICKIFITLLSIATAPWETTESPLFTRGVRCVRNLKLPTKSGTTK